MIKELKSMFEKQAGVERFDLIQTFHACKQEEGKPFATYVLQMKGYVDQLERLDYALLQDLTVAKGKGKANGKGNDKQVYIPKPKNPKPSAKEHPAKDDTCHHCKEEGHWKRNFHVYLAESLKKKKQVGSVSSSGVFTIELFAFPNKSWVYDTGCGTNICITKQGFSEARKLKQGVLYLYVGNGVRAQVEAIGSYDLVLPNSLVICLDNCHYAPSITRGVVSVHRLVENGFIQYFTDFEISVSKNNVHYFNAISSNGIYEIDMHDLVPNVNSIYNVSTKRAKHNLDSTYLWHCRLTHIIFETFKVFKNEVENQLGKTMWLFDQIKVVWGCEALAKRDTPAKLQQRSVKCIFIGYQKETMGYYLYFPPENKIVVAMYDEFFEKNFITQEVSRRAIDLEEIQDEDTSPFEITSEIPMEVEGFEPPQEEVISIRRSERTHRVPNRLCLNVEINAMNVEIQSMIDNMVWVLVDIPPNCKTVGSKWIFKKKTDMDGIVHTYKARLVANGYTQLYRVDYEKTFLPIADTRVIRILISIAAFYDYEIWQIDVKATFLNGYLDEDIYMVQPEGFVDLNHPRKVCKLQRSIYGLEQASRSWNKRFDEEIKKFGFALNLDEPCVYQKASESNVTFLILDRSKRLIGLGQNAYKDKILKRYKMDNFKRGHIPMQEKLDLNKAQGASTPKEVKCMQNVPYASAVGSIMYAVRCTRPDVGFAQNITSRFQQNPGDLHQTAVKNILKYLRNTKDMFLVYGRNSEAELRVDCYYDVGFETDRDDTKSQTGYVFILNGGVKVAVSHLFPYTGRIPLPKEVGEFICMPDKREIILLILLVSLGVIHTRILKMVVSLIAKRVIAIVVVVESSGVIVVEVIVVSCSVFISGCNGPSPYMGCVH
uniref:Uncharacterized protein n=1 Tax=Tanacetum cinerariifolium TaxID=118510 RepID=A0A6L2MVM8_TANCI|nr:hypothetical protein [Tanacetum cinerariifolium]